ncbi:MAG: hypothetical protein AAF368_15435, partial [Planctomycetota bacterium]
RQHDQLREEHDALVRERVARVYEASGGYNGRRATPTKRHDRERRESLGPGDAESHANELTDVQIRDIFENDDDDDFFVDVSNNPKHDIHGDSVTPGFVPPASKFDKDA